jgi:geranyl-CoA carboxylase beta subunit
MIRRQSTVYLAGPPLLKAATGEIATDEEIGGADMHGQIAGTADYIAENDADGIRIAREIVASLGWNRSNPSPGPVAYQEPLYPAEELPGLVPENSKIPYDVREIIARIADGSEFLEFKPEFDAGTVCGHLSIQGCPCGLIGNNAPITAQGAAKAGQFIQLCQQAGTPLLFLHNTTGFVVGTHPGRHQQHGAENQRCGGRVLRRGQLRHVRPWHGPPVHVRLAAVRGVCDGP